MPAHSQTPKARNFEPAAIDSETVAVLFEAETFEPVPPFESGIPRLFPSLHTAEEGLKGFVEVADDRLQHMAVNVSGTELGGFEDFDLT
jgi:hypothetical protein